MTQMNKKLVVVLNKSIETGKALNSAAHMAVALGAEVGHSELELIGYRDADGHHYPPVSKIPFIVLRANSNKIKTLDNQANELNIRHVTFTDAMNIGGWEQQIEKSKNTTRDDLIFYGIALYGEFAVIHNLTKKFSLYQ